MRFSIVLAAGILLAGAVVPAAAADVGLSSVTAQTSQTDAISAAKRKKRATGQQAYGRGGGPQIACTQFGCNPIPPGCRIRTGYNPWTWDPSGFDEVVCPYR